jgi:hypothetical protein
MASGAPTSEATHQIIIKPRRKSEHFFHLRSAPILLANVYYDSTGPMAQLGFGLKRRGRPRKTGGALYVAGQN